MTRGIVITPSTDIVATAKRITAVAGSTAGY
jgi:hypothetical protein